MNVATIKTNEILSIIEEIVFSVITSFAQTLYITATCKRDNYIMANLNKYKNYSIPNWNSVGYSNLIIGYMTLITWPLFRVLLGELLRILEKLLLVFGVLFC